MSQTYEITWETDSYNDRRYGKPWAAIVDFESDKKGLFKWIDWVGEKGCRGEFSLKCSPGTVVACGQKDIRKNRGGVNDGWYVAVLNSEGELELIRCKGKIDARNQGRAINKELSEPKNTVEQLQPVSVEQDEENLIGCY